MGGKSHQDARKERIKINEEYKKMLEEFLKKSMKHDVYVEIPFQCLIGKTKAILAIHIEPDPHGNGKGTHAHFHTTIICPKLKIVDVPEPDRCKITDKTCPFVAPFGSHLRSPELRKQMYVHDIVQSLAFIEYYGTQLVNKKIFMPLGVKVNTLRLSELNRLLIATNLISKEQFEKLEKIRKTRNRLVHDPDSYLDFDEKELYELSMEAGKLASKLVSLLQEAKNRSNMALFYLKQNSVITLDRVREEN